MKRQAEVAGEKHQVEVERDGENVFAVIDGRKYELDVSEPEPNVFLFKHSGKIHEVFVSPQAAPNEPFIVNTGSSDFEIKLIDPKRLRGTGSDNEHAGGSAEVKTAMPGKVVRILVSEGDAVAKGDGVIVVEAMKMQNEMKAPKDGVVSQINVAEGATVSAGDVLVTIE